MFKKGHKFFQGLAEKNSNWQGDNVGYGSLHRWVIRRLPKPEICPSCNKRKAHDLANRGIYDRNLKNWEWLCRKCHMQSDGRLNIFMEMASKAKPKGRDSYLWKGRSLKAFKRQKILKYGKADNYICKHCKNKQAKFWSNVNHKDFKNLDNFKALCISCSAIWARKFYRKK
jgi:hypothetical protein